VIKISNLYKSFGEQRVLNDIDLTIEKGSTTVIIGPSGEGKSVLLKHLIGLLKPDSGQILVDGEDITKLKGQELKNIRKKFGMLFQDAALFDSLDVFENVAFPLREHTEMLDDEIEERVLAMLKLVNLEGADKKWPSQLSGGMKKRVGLARALMLHPKILLFDEPTTGLDPIISDQICALIENMHGHFKTTQVIISHDLKATVRLADKIAMLQSGMIVYEAEPDEFLKSSNETVRSFLEKA
jgi:phospholipid/cholesterol/gamma-HCH transport system ATP-binding protein